MRVASFALFSAVLLACVGDPPAAGDAGKMTGEEGGPCFSDFTCKTGLLCNLGPNTCVKPGTDGAVVDTGTDGGSSDDGGADSGVTCIGRALAYWPAESSPVDKLAFLKLDLGGTAMYAGGRFGNGFAFGTNTLHVTTNAVAGLNELTLEFWMFYATTLAGSVAVASVYDPMGGVQFMDINLDSNGALLWSLKGPGVVTTAGVTANAWHHVGFVYSSGVMSTFLDGKAATTVNTGAGMLMPLSSGAVLTFGGDYMGNSLFPGVMDEIAIYRGALSLNDMVTLSSAKVAVCRIQ